MKPGVLNSRCIAERRARVAGALESFDEILVVGAGEPVPLPEALIRRTRLEPIRNTLI